MSSMVEKMSGRPLEKQTSEKMSSEQGGNILRTELNKAIHKIEFLEIEHQYLRECLKSAQETLSSRNGSVQNLQSQLREERQKYIQFFEAHASFERDTNVQDSSNKIDKQEHELLMAQYNEQIQALKSRNTDLESNNLSLYDSYRAIKSQLENVRKEYLQAQSETEQIIETLKSSRDLLQKNAAENRSEGEFKARDLQEKFQEKMRSIELENEQLMNQLRQEIQGLQSQLHSMQAEHENEINKIVRENDQQIQNILQQHQEQLHENEKVIFLKVKENDQLADKLESSKQQAWELQEQAQSLLNSEKEIKAQIEGLHIKMTAQQEEASSMQNQLTATFNERNSLAVRLEQTQEDLKASNNRQKCINDVIADQNEEVARLNSVNLQMAKAYREKEKEILSLQEIAQLAVAKYQDAEMRIKQLEHENNVAKHSQQTYQLQAEDQSGRAADLQAKIKTLTEQVEGREKQYRFYIDNLNRSKRELREEGLRFIQELRVSKQMSPMHDFLKVTNREISRVEIQLKRTPTLSPDRSRLEQCLTDLVEQRDFLTENLDKTTNDIEKKINRLSEIIGGETMAMTPPPPPAL